MQTPAITEGPYLTDSLAEPAASGWLRIACEKAGLTEAMAGCLSQWRELLRKLPTVLDRTKAASYLRRGRALTAGLITKEATGCGAAEMSYPVFRHGPLELLRPDVQAVVFACGEVWRALKRGMCEEIAATGAGAFWCGTDAAHGAFGLPPAPGSLVADGRDSVRADDDARVGGARTMRGATIHVGDKSNAMNKHGMLIGKEL